MNLVDLHLRNTSFSPVLPGLQVAVDSTSLGEFKTCARRYQYGIVEGWEPREQSVHLVFGIAVHKALERYSHARADGVAHDEALAETVRSALIDTWNSELKRPIAWDHRAKTRTGLIRTIIWYLDQFGANDPLETVILANGKPAVELSFSFNSGFIYEATGESNTMCGHMDRLARLGTAIYVVDPKTTEHTLDPGFFSKFTPDNQFSLYCLAGRVVYQTPLAGLIVDGIQIGVGFTRVHRSPVPRDDSTLDEWFGDLKIWLGQMEAYAVAQHWPMNDKACGMYGGCKYRSVCSKPPASRELWLKANFTQRIWDPLQRRGDI